MKNASWFDRRWRPTSVLPKERILRLFKGAAPRLREAWRIGPRYPALVFLVEASPKLARPTRPVDLSRSGESRCIPGGVAQQSSSAEARARGFMTAPEGLERALAATRGAVAR